MSLIWQQQQQQQRHRQRRRLLWIEALTLLLFEHRVELVRQIRQHVADIAENVGWLATDVLDRRGVLLLLLLRHYVAMAGAVGVFLGSPRCALLYRASVLVGERERVGFCARTRL